MNLRNILKRYSVDQPQEALRYQRSKANALLRLRVFS